MDAVNTRSEVNEVKNRRKAVAALIPLVWFGGMLVGGMWAFLTNRWVLMAEILVVGTMLRIPFYFVAPRVKKWVEAGSTVNATPKAKDS